MILERLLNIAKSFRALTGVKKTASTGGDLTAAQSTDGSEAKPAVSDDKRTTLDAIADLYKKGGVEGNVPEGQDRTSELQDKGVKKVGLLDSRKDDDGNVVTSRVVTSTSVQKYPKHSAQPEKKPEKITQVHAPHLTTDGRSTDNEEWSKVSEQGSPEAPGGGFDQNKQDTQNKGRGNVEGLVELFESKKSKEADSASTGSQALPRASGHGSDKGQRSPS